MPGTGHKGGRGAERGMARKWKFGNGCENTSAVICPRSRGRQDKSGLGKICPRWDALHLLVAQIEPIQHQRHGVAQVRGGGEDIHLHEVSGPGHGSSVALRTAPAFMRNSTRERAASIPDRGRAGRTLMEGV